MKDGKSATYPELDARSYLTSLSHNSRASNRVASLWLYQTLYRQFKKAFNLDYPKLPEPVPLWPTPLMETADYEVIDIVMK
jgi:hypothetical protein